MHPGHLESGEIQVKFFLANVMSLIQPMDQGILEAVKQHYQGFLLRSILQECEGSGSSITDA